MHPVDAVSSIAIEMLEGVLLARQQRRRERVVDEQWMRVCILRVMHSILIPSTHPLCSLLGQFTD